MTASARLPFRHIWRNLGFLRWLVCVRVLELGMGRLIMYSSTEPWGLQIEHGSKLYRTFTFLVFQ